MTSSENKGFGELFAEMGGAAAPPKRQSRAQVGDRVGGPVVVIAGESVFIDIGAKAEAVIDRAELLDDDGNLTVKVGDRVDAHVVSKNDGAIVLRKKMSAGGDVNLQFETALKGKVPIEGKVTAVNKGGVEVEVFGVRAFCPMSQLDLRFVEDPSVYLGQKHAFLVTRVEAGRGSSPNVVVSRRALLEQENAVVAEKTRATLSVGAIISGTISHIKPFGAFVDLGGLEGMIHVSELGFGRVESPDEVLKVGQMVEVQVLRMDPPEGKQRERIALSLKALQDDPFVAAVDGLTVGMEIKGEVVRTESYGAFVKLPNGVEALLHVSQIPSERRLVHAREAMSVGDAVEATVVEIDHEKRRVGLSMKGLDARRERAQVDAYRPKAGSMGTLGDLFKKHNA